MNRVEEGKEKKVVSTMVCSVIHGVVASSYRFVKEMVETLMKTGYNSVVLYLQDTENVQ